MEGVCTYLAHDTPYVFIYAFKASPDQVKTFYAVMTPIASRISHACILLILGIFISHIAYKSMLRFVPALEVPSRELQESLRGMRILAHWLYVLSSNVADGFIADTVHLISNLEIQTEDTCE